MRFLILIFSALLVIPAPAAPLATSEAESPWATALTAYQQENYPRAAERWEQWIHEDPTRVSSEAFYNLSAAYGHMGEFGPSVRNLLRSARLKANPYGILRELHLAREIENKIGVKDGITKDPAFLFYFLLNPDVSAYLFSLGIWLFAFATLLFAWKKIRTFSAVLMWVVSVISITLVSAGWINRTFIWDVGVIESKTGSVALMKSPGDDPGDKLVELPAGTVVNLTRNEATVRSRIHMTQKYRYAEINAPLSGWVSYRSVIPLNDEPSSSPAED